MTKVLRALVLIADIGFLIFLSWSLFMVGPHDSDSLAIAGFILLFVMNIYIILSKGNDAGWFSLLLQRKALEEQNKIAEIRKRVS